MLFGLFKSKEERKKEKAERLAPTKESRLKKEELRKKKERLKREEEAKFKRFSVQDLPKIYKKLEENKEEDLRAELQRLGNTYDEVKQKEKIKARIREAQFWEKVKDYVESTDEYPYWHACSLMDDTIRILETIIPVENSLKELERKYGKQLEYAPKAEYEKLAIKYNERLALYEGLSTLEQENSMVLENVVLTAIKKEMKINPPPEWPSPLVNEMSQGLSMRHVIDLWKSYSIERYITEKGLLEPLLRKRSQLVYADDYGEERKEKWEQEIYDFCKRRNFNEINAVCARLPVRLKTLLDKWVEIAKKRIEWTGSEEAFSSDFYWFAFDDDKSGQWDNVKSFSSLLERCLASCSARKSVKPDKHDESTGNVANSPYEFERRIGRKFKILGWDSLVTRGSGDQGAYIVITKGDMRGIVKCSLYLQPVKNETVQEVHDAQAFYDTNFAVIVSNQSLSVSTRILANKLNVYLINEDEIKEFSELFS